MAEGGLTESNITLDDTSDPVRNGNVLPPHPRAQLPIHIEVQVGSILGG